jgi:hypothetical protein
MSVVVAAEGTRAKVEDIPSQITLLNAAAQRMVLIS